MTIAAVTQPKLKHFRPAEFGIFWPLMSHDLLTNMDTLRAHWGRPIRISPVAGAIGRLDESNSQHNVINTLGVIKALDFFPAGSADDGGLTINEARDFVDIMRQIGFKGIGVYTDTEPSIMIHGDVRDTDRVATWSRIAGQYTSIDKVIA